MNQKGFSLIELVATIVILGIVASITIFAVGGGFSKTKAKTEDVFIKTIEDSLNIFTDSSDAKSLTFSTEKCTIHVSAPEISVPNVVGKMQAQAEQELKKAGFEVDSSKKGQDKNKPKGAVLKQSATSAPKGSTIVITINTYSASPDTPSTNTTPAPKNETSHSNTVSNTTKPSN